MSWEENYHLSRQIGKWEERREELNDWIAKNGVTHPEFETKYRQLNNAILKVEQLETRKAGYKPADTAETITLPQRRPQTHF